MKMATLVLPQFQEALRKLNELKLPVSTSWKLAKISKKLEEELKLYSDSREESLKRFADKDEEGKPIITEGNYQLSKEAMQEYNTGYLELLSQEIEVGKLSISKDLANCELTANELITLEPIIND